MVQTKAEWSHFSPRSVQGKKVRLAMQELWLTGQILPVGARLVIRHVFQSAEKKPLEVVYAFPLPRDAALRQFRIEGRDFKAHSKLRTRPEAQEIYERGLEHGHMATMARLHRTRQCRPGNCNGGQIRVIPPQKRQAGRQVSIRPTLNLFIFNRLQRPRRGFESAFPPCDPSK